MDIKEDPKKGSVSTIVLLQWDSSLIQEELIVLYIIAAMIDVFFGTIGISLILLVFFRRLVFIHD